MHDAGDPVWVALPVHAHVRSGDACVRLVVGFRIGIARVCRYVREAVDLLAAAGCGRAVPTAAFRPVVPCG
jgi:hypothetical protein